MPTLLFFLLLTSTELPSTYGRSSCSTSCGRLKINHPLRLKGDPSECGELELSCQDDNALLDLQTNSYYVSHITFMTGLFFTATLLDANVAHGNCSLPTGPFPMESFRNRSSLTLDSTKWITFMNCSEMIHDDERYRLVPCLSRLNSSSFIYAVDGHHADRIGVLKPKCYFLVKIPTNSDLDAYEDIFQLLRQWFSVLWGHYTYPVHLKGFVGFLLFILEAPFRNRWKFSRCIYESGLCRHDFLTNFLATISELLLFAAILTLVYFLLCRFVLAPLCLLVFLASKMFKLFKPIDMVERFLRTQEALSPQRYTYNEIIAMTSNYAEKIGHCFTGSVRSSNVFCLTC